MREGLFLKKNIEKWKRYQYGKETDPDKMADEFTELVNDLGYAKTFYPHSKVTHYLNELASRTYLKIYRNKREEGSRIWRFWKTELPLTVARYFRPLLCAFLLFTGMAIMGAYSAAHDESFVRGVLGDSYVDGTEENITKGDPFGVYKQGDKLSMFVYIANNNIRVAFMTFVSGIFLSIGTAWYLFSNGVMLGSFQYMFFAKGLGWDSVLVIWIHGTLEISAIILAGGAGFILGNSILFPGNNKRIDSLKRGAKDGLKLVIGLIPIFITAAFFEGYVTRHTDMPRWLSISILASSFLFICWYFVYYPIQLSRRIKISQAEGRA
ncbi:MAG: stage II sporulation protein M [Candidatus Pseudobacter hemicellulosilyticus]|uniref:Stage II sporulation protein M n=1 Tax=Candidatus Pseudobacter hemicellulosilyticus TaxID=3121375 RepID=A0AAJ5WMQ1_9BACT|nr:MAG: stage II sporulation protein M [Pseudobacter sp.]